MSDLAYKRADRVAQMLQQEIGLLLVNGVKDPRVGFVTVTEVRLLRRSAQCQSIRFVYGDDAQRETSLQGFPRCRRLL
ncbi:MAG: hypothetical protein R3C68_04605 [Myxococcota bacterium]